jgi:hypothetical protein
MRNQGCRQDWLLRQDSKVSATPRSWHVSLRRHGRGPKIGDSDPAGEFGGVTSVAGFSDAGGATAFSVGVIRTGVSSDD